MGITKRLNWQNIFIFLFFIAFPFGQIIRIGILQPLDVIVGAGAILSIFKNCKKPKLFKYLNNFLIAAGFSWILSALIFRQKEVFYGLLYLIRLGAYSYFFIYIWNFVRTKKEHAALLINSLLAVSVVSAVLGWLQYFIFPSIKPFFVWGWDEHFLRLVGTFLDPTFLGLIIVLGLLLSINRFIDSKKIWYIYISVFLLVSLAFTYSRASYLALIAGLIVIASQKKIFRNIAAVILGLGLLILILPTSSNHVLRFTRIFSAVARVENYTETINIFRKFPIFGVGYDNLCMVRSNLVGYPSYASHACSGSDSSLLFILATTGIIGFLIFANFIREAYLDVKHGFNFTILSSSFVALLTHSLFSNSMFYPWIMGYLAILLAISLKE